MSALYDFSPYRPARMSEAVFARLCRRLITEEEKLSRLPDYACLNGEPCGQSLYIALTYLRRVGKEYISEEEYTRSAVYVLRKVFQRKAGHDIARRRRRRTLEIDAPGTPEQPDTQSGAMLDATLNRTLTWHQVCEELRSANVDEETAHAWAWYVIENWTWLEVTKGLQQSFGHAPKVPALRKRAERLRENASIMHRLAIRLLDPSVSPPT